MVDDLSRRIRTQFEGLRAEVGNATALLTNPAQRRPTRAWTAASAT